MTRVDPFTRRRIIRFIEEFRTQNGQLPTLRDFAKQHIEESQVDGAIRDGAVEMVYVTLTNGNVVKGYKVVFVEVR